MQTDEEKEYAFEYAKKIADKFDAEKYLNAWHPYPTTLAQKMYAYAMPRQYTMLKNAPYVVIPVFRCKGLSGEYVSKLNPFSTIWCVIENIFLAATAEGLACSMRIPLGEELDLSTDFNRDFNRLELKNMIIRTATENDLEQIASVEAECFPPAEAASKEEFAERLRSYGNHFWLMFDEDKLIAFVDGFVTDEPDLTDEMYANADMHNENGAWQMIFGVNTLPEYRRHGYAEELIQYAIDDARHQNRKGLVLTCKDKLVHYYAKFGFIDEGVSDKSTHGNVVWHQMRLTF